MRPVSMCLALQAAALVMMMLQVLTLKLPWIMMHLLMLTMLA